jgi:ABC-2 type transport system permease protein
MNDPELIHSATRPMYWSVRRELLENRSIYIAPLVVAALALFGFFLGSFAGIWEKALRLDVTQAASKVAEPYTYVSGLLMATTFIVGVFYSLDALYGERRDRSILFWKSLPVSDLTAVLSKAIVAIVVLPLLTFVITIITQALMLLVSSAILLASGQSVAMLWAKLPLLRMTGMLLHHLVVVHGLWHAPLFAWLLLVSATVRNLPFVWAILPLAAIPVLERIAFRTSHFATMLGTRMSGGDIGGAVMKPTAMHMHAGFAEFLIDPVFWIGLVVTALLLAAAVRQRRNRGPI